MRNAPAATGQFPVLLNLYANGALSQSPCFFLGKEHAPHAREALQMFPESYSTDSGVTQLFGQLQNPELPDARTSGRLIWHPKSKALLLIDGYQIHLEGAANHVWKWDGHRWTKVDASGPGTKSLSAGDLDRKTGVIQIFGGVGSKDYKSLKGDTWAFNGERWTAIKTNDIGTRDHHQMVYAEHINAFVLFGGTNSARTFDSTTWILKKGHYKALAIPGPGSRYHFGMAYDRQRKVVVLYGGFLGKNRKMSDELWEFDGRKWVKKLPLQPIGPRAWNTLAYHDSLKMVVMQGGKTITQTDAGETWSSPSDTWGWNGKTWVKIAENGPSATLPALGYDPLRQVLVAFGGSGENGTIRSDLWEMQGREWKKISDNGVWKWNSDKNGFERL